MVLGVVISGSSLRGGKFWRGSLHRYRQLPYDASIILSKCLRSDIPHVFATLSRATASPPFRAAMDPNVALLLGVQALEAHTELEVFELRRACGHLTVAIERA